MRFKLIIEYDGTDYHGWQVQPNGPTIQSVLEEAVARMLGETTRVVAAGRTDAGVHAAGQVVSFSVQRAVSAEVLMGGLNALTPRDISIKSAEGVADDFDPRRAARSRVYVYRIWNARWMSPFWRRYAWHVARPLDCERMRAAALVLLGEHDFSSFQAAGCDAAHPIRRVLRSDVDRADDLVVYTIEATAFLRHMVRNIIGTLVDVGTGERSADNLIQVLAAGDRTRAGPTAPARGLCLTEVRY
ncbi:MAG TPA: tRNA pseudouridine(38-40) synthase TruA [Candidatus Acidoferrales bacterium]|nr:tRNA pseudouridine(38-40) synthase TruA [Candidatus Acidoferrales bacterium]